MNEEYHKYEYDGPVMEFGKLVTERWKGETQAPTEKKARSNLAYRFKKQFNRIPGSKITLPGEIIVID